MLTITFSRDGDGRGVVRAGHAYYVTLYSTPLYLYLQFLFGFPNSWTLGVLRQLKLQFKKGFCISPQEKRLKSGPAARHTKPEETKQKKKKK